MTLPIGFATAYAQNRLNKYATSVESVLVGRAVQLQIFLFRDWHSSNFVETHITAYKMM